MCSWNALRDLIVRGTSAPVTATLVLHGDFDGSQFGWMVGGERIASLVLGPGNYRLIRDHRRRKVTEMDGTPPLLDADDGAVVMTDGDPVDGSENLSVTTPATWLLYPRQLLGTLDQIFPAGLVDDVAVRGRRAYRIPGLPGRHLDSSGRARWIDVDAVTGVVLAMDTGGGGGELVDVDFPDVLDASVFSWDDRYYGPARRPEPWQPLISNGTTDVLEPAPEPVDERPLTQWSERRPTEGEEQVFRDICEVAPEGSVPLPGYDFVQEHPDGGYIVLNERVDDDARMLVYHLGRAVDGEVHWAEKTYSLESWKVFVIDGRIFTSDETTLTLRDRNLEVVKRYWAPASNHWLEVVGPWFGAFQFRLSSIDPGWSEDDDSGMYQLLDPDTLDVVLEVPVDESDVAARWINGELWLSDGNLRIFTPPW
ncbi:hypothetical protein [Corynebacterium glyciniphilum]|uniref:hypothetical protein n=1 Tax=Corynebacterium glyciniphilum TaxID=1404244 RepID=UPI0026513B3D|nr:hypothetical protein [Corynebacterium glyciniphilum]MDN5682339.1 hypothetical protein [Corynebacterium glyciniphilum]MDN6706463.1 hypothetical protein [Corynebacterium glyciniphilum]